MTRKKFISEVLYSLAATDSSVARELTLKEAFDRVNERADEETFDDEPKSLYDWDSAPPNATHATINSQRHIEWWASEPIWQEHYWDHGGVICLGKRVFNNVLSEDSLEKRPAK